MSEREGCTRPLGRGGPGHTALPMAALGRGPVVREVAAQMGWRWLLLGRYRPYLFLKGDCLLCFQEGIPWASSIGACQQQTFPGLLKAPGRELEMHFPAFPGVRARLTGLRVCVGFGWNIGRLYPCRGWQHLSVGVHQAQIPSHSRVRNAESPASPLAWTVCSQGRDQGVCLQT